MICCILNSDLYVQIEKISASAILAIALIVVTMTAALAAGLGLFGELAHNPNTDNRLTQLDEVAEPMSVSLHYR